jgi:hypothetical protein
MQNFFFDNFFYNFSLSILFLLLNFLLSLALCHKFFANRRIHIFQNKNVAVYLVFITIISIYAFLINLTFIFHLTKYLKFIVIFLSFFFFIYIFLFKKFEINKFLIYKNIFLDKYIFYFLFLFLLISIMPLSDADSIATHLIIPAQIFQDGSLSNNLLRDLENVLISNTETILSFSFILKSDNFGSILNLFSLFIFFLTFRKKTFFYIFLCSPLIIFFISSQKLQLFFGLLYLTLFILVYENNIKSKFEIFLFVFLLTFYSSGKLTYILFSVFLFLLFLFKNKNFIKISFLFLFISFFIHQFPILFYKYLLFENPFAPFFDQYFKKREILDALVKSLKSSEGWYGKFDLSMIYKPFITFDLFKLGTTFGLVFPLLLFDFKYNKKLFFIPYLIIVSIIVSGQLLPRYYLEAYLILVFYLKYTNIFKIINIFQGFFVILFSIIFLFLSFANLQKDNWSKSSFNRKFTYTYFNSEILNKKIINQNVLLVSYDRNSIFFEKNIYSSRYLNTLNGNGTNNKNYDMNFNNFIKDANIKYIVFESSDIRSIPSCITLDIFDEFFFKKALRNFLVDSKIEKFFIGKIIKNECR